MQKVNNVPKGLKKEESESVTKCNRLKLPAADGKSYFTDLADPETLLRSIQSVPSPKAEPIKLWLAKVGYERIQDMSDPARSLDRALEYWRQHGRSEKWIQQRMMGQETRNKLTDYWKGHEIKGEDEYACLGMAGASLSKGDNLGQFGDVVDYFNLISWRGKKLSAKSQQRPQRPPGNTGIS